MPSMIRATLGLFVAVGLLFLLFRGTDAGKLAASLREVNLGWLLLGQVLLWGSFFTRAQRWSYVVRAAHPASFRSLLSASQIGFLVNFTVPARIGEWVRAWVLARLVGISVARSMAMVALDRVNDVIGLLMVVGVAAFALSGDVHIEFPVGSFGNAETIAVSGGIVQTVAWVLAGGTAAAAPCLLLLFLFRGQVLAKTRAALEPLSTRLAHWVVGQLDQFAEGLHIFRSGSDLARAFFWTLVTWAADVAAVAAIVAAFGVTFPWWTPFVVLAVLAIGLAVPITPGTVGQFHVAAVVGLLLSIPGLDPTRAKAIAIVDHLSTLLPIAALGIWSLFREQLGILQVIRRAGEKEPVSVLRSETHG